MNHIQRSRRSWIMATNKICRISEEEPNETFWWPIIMSTKKLLNSFLALLSRGEINFIIVNTAQSFYCSTLFCSCWSIWSPVHQLAITGRNFQLPNPHLKLINTFLFGGFRQMFWCRQANVDVPCNYGNRRASPGPQVGVVTKLQGT